MENRSGHLWQPIHKFSKNNLLQDLDWAVQAQVRIQVSAHLYSNMKGLLEEGFSLQEFEELTQMLCLAPHLKTHFLLNQLALRHDEFQDLYLLEQELWRLFSTNEHDCIVTQALDLYTLKYPIEFSEIIKRHIVNKHGVGADFKNWLLHDGFKDLVRIQQRCLSGPRLTFDPSSIVTKVSSFFTNLITKFS